MATFALCASFSPGFCGGKSDDSPDTKHKGHAPPPKRRPRALAPAKERTPTKRKKAVNNDNDNDNNNNTLSRKRHHGAVATAKPKKAVGHETETPLETHDSATTGSNTQSLRTPSSNYNTPHTSPQHDTQQQQPQEHMQFAPCLRTSRRHGLLRRIMNNRSPAPRWLTLHGKDCPRLRSVDNYVVVNDSSRIVAIAGNDLERLMGCQLADVRNADLAASPESDDSTSKLMFFDIIRQLRDRCLRTRRTVGIACQTGTSEEFMFYCSVIYRRCVLVHMSACTL